VALSFLAVRSVARLEPWYDAWLYHVPFAAHYGSLGVRYTNTDPDIAGLLGGSPPLPFVAHGALWRLTGSLNAIGVRNFAALLLFFYYAVRVLRARFAVVVLVSLTAPLVVIHAATTYYDLFANTFLAIGVSGIAVLALFDRGRDRRLLVWILAGLTLAAWSKPVVLPVVCPALGLLLVHAIAGEQPRRRERVSITLAACALGAAPYVRDWVVFGNPIWPNRVPLLASIPYTQDFLDRETPPLLRGLPHYQVFLRSLFEIGQPTEYPDRARWTVDQGHTLAGFRCGGFWGVAVVCSLGALVGLAILFAGRRAAPFLAGAVATLALVAVVPDSHNLRYFLFFPLTWAAILGALEVPLSRRRPRLMTAFVAGSAAPYAYATALNRGYYAPEPLGYAQVARRWMADGWWPALDPNEAYCAIKPPFPSAVFLTGPTMREFRIDERRSAAECPRGSVVLDWSEPRALTPRELEELGRLMTEAVEAQYTRRDLEGATARYREVLARCPEHYGALVQLARALDSAADAREALAAWRAVKRVELLRGYGGEDSAYSSARIASLAPGVEAGAGGR
jgi:hypothetical protein